MTSDGNLHRDQQEPLPSEALTWAGLLAQWVDFAQRALALPGDETGRRMRDSVPDLIMLQAVWFALQRMDQLDPAERALGLDRAQVLIDKHAGVLAARWPDEQMPAMMRELIHDAQEQMAQARQAEESR